jgi:hypothetical protein
MCCTLLCHSAVNLKESCYASKLAGKKKKLSIMKYMLSFDMSGRQEKIMILKHVVAVPSTRNKSRWVNSLSNKIWIRGTGCSNFRSIVISCCVTPLKQSVLWLALVLIQEQQRNMFPVQGKAETVVSYAPASHSVLVTQDLNEASCFKCF